MSNENNNPLLPPPPISNLNFSLISILNKEKLTNHNYLVMIHNPRISLRYDGIEDVLDEDIWMITKLQKI